MTATYARIENDFWLSVNPCKGLFGMRIIHWNYMVMEIAGTSFSLS